MVSFSGFLVSLITGLVSTLIGNEYDHACRAVKAAISDASDVYYPGDPLYIKGNYHYFASSRENPACVVEPGTPEDIGKILKVIEDRKTPFAVKSGGHTINPGFSSTKGIHIYTGRFSQVTYDPASSTAVIGSGLVWDTVYEQLQPYNVTVIGARVTGVGVGGFLLGGGYSYKTNQHGLGLDTVVGFNLVLPNGTVVDVTQSTHPDLFFGLKGGYNNFGIVTDFTMTTFPQTEVWGGCTVYSSLQFDQIRPAMADFSVHSKDPKAMTLLSYSNIAGIPIVVGSLFYDGPTPPAGTFDNFTSVPSVSGELKTRSYLDMVLSIPSNSSAGHRGSWQMTGVTRFTETLLEAVESEMTYWTNKLTPMNGTIFTYTIEPAFPTYLSHANSPSAFPSPAARKVGNAPALLHVFFGWENPLYDDVFVSAVEESTNRLAAVAEAEGLLSNPVALYGNSVNFRTPLVDIYGDNLPALQELKAKIDPKKIMNLAGGFKF